GPTGTEERWIGGAVGGAGLNAFQFYVGPKDKEILESVHPKLAQLMDWGWASFLTKPILIALLWTVDHLTHNYGWAIVLVTIAINTILFPLRFSSMRSAKKMQVLQPQLKAINDKYKGLALNDPKKVEQNQELMDFYKQNGVNPAGGCVPLVLQIPFFYAF